MLKNDKKAGIYTPAKGEIVFSSSTTTNSSDTDIYTPVKGQISFSSGQNKNNSASNHNTNKQTILNKLYNFISHKKKK